MFEMPAGVEFTDDFDVQLNPEEYQDQALPLPLAGNFGVRIKKSSLKKEYEKETLVLVDGKYPVIRIEELEIADPAALIGRRVFPFQDFGTKPFERPLFPGSTDKLPANNLADILRSHDATISFRSLQDGLDTFSRLTAEGAIFYVQLDWLAEDRKWIGEQVKVVTAAAERGEITEQEAKDKLKEIRYKLGRREGKNNFKVVNPTTKEVSFNPVFESPSGKEIEATSTIRKWISKNQLDKFKLGAK